MQPSQLGYIQAQEQVVKAKRWSKEILIIKS